MHVPAGYWDVTADCSSSLALLVTAPRTAPRAA